MERYYTIQLGQHEENNGQLDIIIFDTKKRFTVDTSAFIQNEFMSNMDHAINELNKIGYKVVSYDNYDNAILSKKESSSYYDEELHLRCALSLIDYIL